MARPDNFVYLAVRLLVVEVVNFHLIRVSQIPLAIHIPAVPSCHWTPPSLKN